MFYIIYVKYGFEVLEFKALEIGFNKEVPLSPVSESALKVLLQKFAWPTK